MKQAKKRIVKQEIDKNSVVRDSQKSERKDLLLRCYQFKHTSITLSPCVI